MANGNCAPEWGTRDTVLAIRVREDLPTTEGHRQRQLWLPRFDPPVTAKRIGRTYGRPRTT
jgi:hypothetical protein